MGQDQPQGRMIIRVPAAAFPRLRPALRRAGPARRSAPAKDAELLVLRHEPAVRPFASGFAVTPPRCIRRVPCSMNTRRYSRFSSTVSTCRKSTAKIPVAWAVQELPPGRARAARRRADARSSQDLIDGGRRDRDAEPGQLAVDPAVAPQRILFRQANDKAGVLRSAGGRPGSRRLLVSYLLPASLRCQASSVAGVTGKTPVQRPRGISRVSAVNHNRSAGSYRIRPAGRRSTPFSCRSTSSSGPCGAPRRRGRLRGGLSSR
jgi:hypothetical protein